MSAAKASTASSPEELLGSSLRRALAWSRVMALTCKHEPGDLRDDGEHLRCEACGAPAKVLESSGRVPVPSEKQQNARVSGLFPRGSGLPNWVRS
jgi:hypothetical protein